MTRYASGYEPPSHRAERFQGWPEAEYDAVLHLLDRQVVDLDGRLVAKVDDLELVVDADGTLVPTGLLVGLPALLPRFGGRLGEWLLTRHQQAHEVQADRLRPDVIDLGVVESVGSEVHLGVRRAGLLVPRTDAGPGGPERLSLGDLLGLTVRADPALGLAPRSRVLDARLTASPERPGTQHVGALVVGPGRPGLLLGYDRSREAGPAVLAAVVRWLHRHARAVELGPDVEIDRGRGEVRIGAGADVQPLLG